jgi:hypothetical protein
MKYVTKSKYSIILNKMYVYLINENCSYLQVQGVVLYGNPEPDLYTQQDANNQLQDCSYVIETCTFILDNIRMYTNILHFEMHVLNKIGDYQHTEIKKSEGFSETSKFVKC